MNLNKQEQIEFSKLVAKAVVEAFESKGLIGKAEKKPNKTAYNRTEHLLKNYVSFKRVLDERQAEINTIKECGVVQKSSSIVEYSSKGGSANGILTHDELVHGAVRSVQESVEYTVQAIALIDKCMETLKDDPYYKILEMRYFEGRTQDDIAEYFGVSQVTISINKKRLIKELSIKLFPDLAIREMFA